MGGDVKADIANAVNAGKEVTVSKTNITFNDWTGCGYIIIDPDTGAGAYMISGGLSGGLVLGLIILVTALLLLVITTGICIGSAGIGCAILMMLLPFYASFQAWISTMATKDFQMCVIALSLTVFATIFIKQIKVSVIRIILNVIRTFFSGAAGGISCFGWFELE